MKTKRIDLFRLGLICVLLSGRSFLAPPAVAQNESTNFWKNLPQGLQVHGYFEGRSPCREVAKMLNIDGKDSCIKIKWQLLLYQDPVSGSPTTYALGGLSWRNPPKIGKWAIVKGTREDPEAVVYQLESDRPEGFLCFLKADENILLFLDKERNLLVGNLQFSYTLNRVNKP